MRLEIHHGVVGMVLCSTIALGTHLAAAQPAMPDVRTVGEVDPAEPIEVMVTNTTSVPLYAGFAGGANVRIEPNDDATIFFGSAPAHLFIYPFGQDLSTAYETTISGNAIEVQVTPKDSVTPGDSALNVHPSGVVYIY